MDKEIIIVAGHPLYIAVTDLNTQAEIYTLYQKQEVSVESDAFARSAAASCRAAIDVLEEFAADEGSFGWALRQLNAKRAVRRRGWNGKGMFLVLVPGSQGLTVDEGRPLAKAGVPIGTVFNYLPHIDMWTAQGDFVPWLASQTDVLAEDWQAI